MKLDVRTIAFSLALATFGWAAPAEACSLLRTWDWMTDTSLVRMRLTAERDTVYAGRWWLHPESRRWFEFRSPSTALTRVYGQAVRVDDIAGSSGAMAALRAGLAKSGGRAVVVVIGWAPCGDAMPWHKSAQWMPSRQPFLLIAHARDREQWIDGKPTFDVVGWEDPYPLNARRDDATRGAKGPVLSIAEYWDLLNRVPPRSLTGREREIALARLRAWVASQPSMADRFPANLILKDLADTERRGR